MSYLEKTIKDSKNSQNASLAIRIRKTPELLKELMELTSFLDVIDAPVNVRMRYVKMGIKEIKKCKNCSSYIKSVNTDNQFCSNKSCPVIYYNKNKTKEQIEKKSFSISNSYNNKTEEEKEKIKKNRQKTLTLKYGVSHNLSIPGIREKIARDNLEKYGSEIATKNEKVIEKIKETNKEKYGGNSPMCNDLIKSKSRETLYKKYGSFCVPFDTYKEYVMPSGKIIKYLGYENRAFEYLLLEMSENDFLTPGKNLNSTIGSLKYKDNSGKEYRYYPDIYIPKLNKIIEVKSQWTYEINREINDIKGKACKDLGYNFEFWIYTGKSEKQITPKIIKL
jgi:hypothetical protein